MIAVPSRSPAVNIYPRFTYSIGLRVMYARYTSDSRMSAARLNSRTVVVSIAEYLLDVQSANARRSMRSNDAAAMGFT